MMIMLTTMVLAIMKSVIKKVMLILSVIIMMMAIKIMCDDGDASYNYQNDTGGGQSLCMMLVKMIL